MSRPRFLARAQLGPDRVFIQDPFDQQFKTAAGVALTMESRPNHSGVIDDQQVTWGQTGREVTKVAIVHCVGAHVQQT